MLHPDAYLIPQYKPPSEVAKRPSHQMNKQTPQYYNQHQELPNYSATNGRSDSVPIPQTNLNGVKSKYNVSEIMHLNELHSMSRTRASNNRGHKCFKPLVMMKL